MLFVKHSATAAQKQNKTETIARKVANAFMVEEGALSRARSC